MQVARQLNIEFSVAGWAAWAPGLHSQPQWQAWADAPVLPIGDESPSLSEVPAMQRRRIERLGRMAIQTAYWCQDAQAGSMPLVFASRHGDVAGSVKLLESLVAGEPLSPTGFGLSVHNAIGALYSIVRGERGNYLALAGAGATPEIAMVEAAGLLADGAAEVMVIHYEAALPKIYAEFAEESTAFHAWCWRLTRPQQDQPNVTLSCTVAGTEDLPGASGLPHGLDVLRWFLSTEPSRRYCVDGTQWTWQRNA